MTQTTLDLDPGADVRRVFEVTIGERAHRAELALVDGQPQPAEPRNEGYMRGWNAVAKRRRTT